MDRSLVVRRETQVTGFPLATVFAFLTDPAKDP